MCLKLICLLLSTILLAKTTLATNSNQFGFTNTFPSKDSDHVVRIFENEIIKVVECIRQFLINGIGGLSLDPFKFPILPLYFDTTSFSSSMMLTNIFFEGLSGFTLDKGSVSIKPFPPEAETDIALSFGEIKLKTNYNGKMKIANIIRLFGKGSLSMQFDRLKVSLRAVIKVIPLSVKEISLQIQLPSTKAVITGLFNDEYMSGLISRQISETFTQLAQEQQTNFNNFINELLQQLLNLGLRPVLVNWDFDKLVEMAQNQSFTCDLGAQTTVFIFLLACNNNLELTKRTILSHYALKKKLPEIFNNRKVYNSNLQKILNTVTGCRLPKRLNGNAIFVSKLRDTNYQNFEWVDHFKLMSMVIEGLMYSDPPEGVITIIDAEGFSLMHLMKLKLGLLKEFCKYIQEGVPMKISSVQVVNATYYMDLAFSVAKPFVKKEVMDLIHFHRGENQMEILQTQYIPKQYLPKEYGGDLESISTYRQEGIDDLFRLQEYFDLEEQQRLSYNENS
ncbi:hypothetical protein RN001_007072 [Aquatica leii]|uniref:CRAL-TRIO domain-containing protein n=1 Tax=Aquatica leii TaxID=1421715 RepID=A0AAN7S8Y5_9COLE|nr:hypothetical protein RN001_007072 [Aquatica leii]